MRENNNIWEEKNLIGPKKNSLPHSELEQNDTTGVIGINLTPNRCDDIGIKSGIYKIINKVNGKYYIGSSKDIKYRWRCHRSDLKMNKHTNLKLQNAYNKYGKDAFECIIVKLIPPDATLLLKEEQQYLDHAFENKTMIYNICRIAQIPPSWSGKKHKEETKIKMSLNNHMLGKHLSEKTKKLISKNRTGKYHTEEFKKKRALDYCGINNPNYGNHKISGKNHPRYDSKKYKFYNKKLNIVEFLTMFDFYTKYNLDQSGTHRLVNGKYKSQMGWVVITS